MAVLVKTANGLAYASVKTKNGTAVAGLKTINGLDVTSSGGTPALIANIGAALGGGGGTTSSIDTTGANFLVAGIATFDNAPNTPTDSKSNTWVPLTGLGFAGRFYRMYYCANATVGTGHTFTVGVSGGSDGPIICVQAWSNVASAPFDVESGAFAVATSGQPGSITSSQANSLMVSGCWADNSGTSVDSGFTKTDDSGDGSHRSALAYKIKTSATSENPTWTSTVVIECAIAAFKY